MNANGIKGAVLALMATTLLAACGGGGGGGTGGGTVGGGTGGGCTVSCGGGSTGGGTGGGTTYYTHSELAAKFVDYAWDDASLDLSLAKTTTLQNNYIVVYDYDYDTYDAYYIGAWTPTQDVGSYIDLYSDMMYYDLDYLGGNLYEDWYTGVQFEEGSATSKDLAKLAAFRQHIQLKKATSNIQAQFGLSEERSQSVAKLAVQLAKTPKASMTTQDYDNFSQELLGSSITEFQKATKQSFEGDSSKLQDLMSKAAQVNGVGPEQMSKIMVELMSAN